MNFIYGTDITPSTIQNDSMFLSLVDFQTIQSGVEDPNILIDVIGQVSDLGALETVQCSVAVGLLAVCGKSLLKALKLTVMQLVKIRDVASNALTLIESNQDKLEREIRRDPWVQYPTRDIAELRQSTQCDHKVTEVLPKFRIHVWVKDGTGEAYLMLFDWIASGIVPENVADLLNGSFDELKDVESFPEAITSLIGKTFMFGVYIESSNVSSKGGMYKVGKVWKDLSMLLTGGSTTESFTQSDVGTTNLSGSQGEILLLDSQANEDTVITPSSKRKEHSNEGEPDISSTTKKQCTRVFVKKEKTTKEGPNIKKSG
ncbi:hypothetical protein IGI04_029940 [Brassica rapa subsp. trilocularis]|uniref:Uncharacterized protein n=1 Tax=Brassica rapa subsp. trilocularis TaxID=1813537 RepID=A0ABQ7LP91_BRACM|nr:hypothetical protein IGI04_029940 [Brassica rapa subsp. trilocularis]